MSKIFPSEMKTSVIIPNFNGSDLLSDCLSSLKNQTFKDFEIILVDNHSSDDSFSFVTSNYPGVKIISLDRNYGFAKAINEGVKVAMGEYVVFLNNDMFVEKLWIQKLVEFADEHPEVISINSKILSFHQKNLIDGVGISINDVGQARSIGWQEEDKGQFSAPIYIFGATGGASLFRKKDFIKLGMFDEGYFMYSEEVDFAFRAQFAGFKSIYCPGAVVYHRHKATARKFPQQLEYWQFKNMTQTIIKDFPASLLKKDLRWLKIILVHINTFYYQIKNGYFWPPFAVEFWLVRNFISLLKRRKIIQSHIKVSDEYIESFFAKKDLNFNIFRRLFSVRKD